MHKGIFPAINLVRKKKSHERMEDFILLRGWSVQAAGCAASMMGKERRRLLLWALNNSQTHLR
jgi:hypothetical protein